MIRKPAAADRKQWLADLAGSGSWSALRRLRKSPVSKQGRLKDTKGEIVDSCCRADTFAQYLQDAQWAVRPASLIDESPAESLPVDVRAITMKELCDAVKALSSNKAAGPDNQPVEFWKAVLLSDAGGLEGRQWLLDLCNQTWFQQEVPNAWHLQQVAVIYKKGDPADCGNYRPICLLNAAYKIFAMILLWRLLAAGADEKVWATQYGF